MYTVHALPAAYGDGILIEYGSTKPHYIMIDGGPSFNFNEWAEGLKRFAPGLKELELLVITHIDIDHIDGIVTLLNRDPLPFKIREVWFNGYKEVEEAADTLGALQGEYITELIHKKKLVHNKAFKSKAVVIREHKKLPVIKLAGGMELTLLSPSVAGLDKLQVEWEKQLKKYGSDPDFLKKLGEDKRYESDEDILGTTIEDMQNKKIAGDKAAPNGSSIAFLGSFEGKTCLFGGDATSDYLLESVDAMLSKSGKKRLKIDAWKLAHHGSKKSNLDKLMSKIDCKKMIISTNGAHFKHPDPECIAKLLKNNGPGLQFYFNYRSDFNKRWDDKDLEKEYGYKTFFPKKADQPGISVKLK